MADFKDAFCTDQGNNSRVIATSSQANTVYLLAKLHGVQSPEAFALLLANHFLKECNSIDNLTLQVTCPPIHMGLICALICTLSIELHPRSTLG